MSIEILMPALSPTMEEGVLLKWFIKEGDNVKPGDIIAEIETDKATMEVECIDQGVVGKILIPAGTDSVKVNSIIAILLEEGETIEDIKETQTTPKPSLLTDVPSISSSSNPLVADTTCQKEEKQSKEISHPCNTVTSNAEKKVFSSPLARRIAQQKGIDITQIKGSGPHGRVIKADVENAKASTISSSITKDNIASFRVIPQDNLRKTIARRLTESKSSVPHFYLKQDCRIDSLLSLRMELNNCVSPQHKEKQPTHNKISINDMVIRALALSLRDVPEANVAWSSQGDILAYDHVGVAVAVAISGGIITPIIQRAEEKSLQLISQEMKDLVARAKDKKLKPEEYQGGTTSISNLGMFGIDCFSAILNPPQATILAVGAGREAVLINNGKIEIGNSMTVTLSVDHRAIDGAPAAQMMQAFKYYIEHPLSMLL